MPSPTHGADLTTEECTLPDGRTLAYATAGDPDGTPVVFHHGTPGSRLFAAVCADAAAAAGVRLVAPDRPGYGKSTSPPGGWAYDEWRADLHALLDAEGIDRAPLVGFSGGGPFALAAAESDRATRLGLIGTVVPPSNTTLAHLSAVPGALRVVFEVSRGLARLRGSDAVVRQFTDRSVSEAVERAVAADFREALRQGAGAVVRETRLFADSSFEAPPSGVPVRAWHGIEDKNAPLRPVRAFFDGTDGEVETPRSDHLGTLLECQRDVFEWANADAGRHNSS